MVYEENEQIIISLLVGGGYPQSKHNKDKQWIFESTKIWHLNSPMTSASSKTGGILNKKAFQ